MAQEAMTPMYIWPSAPMLFIPLLEDTLMPKAIIIRGIILVRTSQNERMFLNGIEMIIQYVSKTLPPTARIMSAPTTRAMSMAAVMTETLYQSL